jgi:hypothetical protein
MKKTTNGTHPNLRPNPYQKASSLYGGFSRFQNLLSTIKNTVKEGRAQQFYIFNRTRSKKIQVKLLLK